MAPKNLILYFKYCTLFFQFATLIHIQGTTITPGVYLQRLPNITFYQATRQILFKFVKPKHLFEDDECTKQVCKSHPRLCRTIVNVTSYFDKISDTIETGHLSENDMILIDDGEKQDFQYATRNHVPRLFTTVYEVNLLIRQITHVKKIPVHELKYITPLPKLYESLNCSDPLMLPSIMADFVVIYEWTRSFSDMCQSKKLRLDIVPMYYLESALQKIKLEAFNYNFVLSLGTISSYYNLPLTECTISKELALIGVHVPLIRKNLHGMALKRLVTAPFAWNTYTCSANVPNTNVAYIQHPNKNWTILTPSCDPFQEDLCLLNQKYESNAMAISCAEELLHESKAKQISKFCPFSCRETGTATEFITRLDANRYLLTHPNTNTVVICNDTTYEIPATSPIGALTVTLPCDCYIQGQETTITSNDVPCLNPHTAVIFTHTIPAAWTKIQSVSLMLNSDKELKFDTLEDCLDPDWHPPTQETPTIQVTTYLFVLSLMLSCINFIIISIVTHKLMLLSAKTRNFSVNTSGRRTFRRSPSTCLPIPPTPAEDDNDYLNPTPAVPQYETLPIDIGQVSQPTTSAMTLNRLHGQPTEQRTERRYQPYVKLPFLLRNQT